MRRNRKTKIIATLGPSSSSADIIEQLFDSGVDVFRMNFSHGSHDDHRQRFEYIRSIEQARQRPIGVLIDLQGPKLRLGVFTNGSEDLQKNQPFRLDMDSMPGDKTRASLPHQEIFDALEPGCKLMIDDGRIQLEVTESSVSYAHTKVIVGGTVGDNKGVTVPNMLLPIAAVTKKDEDDLSCGLSLGVDWVAQSFVQNVEDVIKLKTLINGRAKLMVKLEKPSALDQLDEILQVCDGVMVARGDLGVELPPQQVPIAQKKIIRRCRWAGKPVVVATHMLDSMVSNPVPTRAEASDVATAVYDGVDTVMLSAESAVGEYPIRSVQIMNDIIEEVEKDSAYCSSINAQRDAPESTTADAICHALQNISEIFPSSVIVTYTTSGSTSLRAARERPHVPILSLTPCVDIARYLTLVWGIHAVTVDVADEKATVGLMIDAAKKIVVQQEFASTGQAVVIAAGLPFGQSGTTNLLHIAWLE